MQRFALAVMTLLTLTAAACSRPPDPALGTTLPFESVSSKPGSPVAVDLWFETPPVSGQTAQVKARAVASVDARDMTVVIKLPSGIRKTGGSDTLRCAPRKNAREELSVDCLIPDDACREITATVTVTLPDGTKFANACALVVGKRRSDPDGRGKPSTNNRGEKIIEFPAR